MQKASSSSVPTAAPGPFFRRIDWSAFWTALIVSFGVYVYTLAPSVTLEDSGELVTASNSLGVPHPPGYPIWSFVTWLFTRVFSFVTFRGLHNPAWSVALASAVFGALAAAITAMLICRSGAQMLRESKGILHTTGERTEDLICWVSGVSCSLLFAFSPCMWSQSVIAEVYSLNAFFLVLIFLLTYWWMSRPSDWLLYVTAYLFGLGLTNYQVLLLALLPLMFAIFLRDQHLFRDMAIVAIPYGAVIVLAMAGALPKIGYPGDGVSLMYLALNAIGLVLACVFLPRGKTVALTVLMTELGVAFYIYMPIVSDLRNPPINWGYPRTWEGFLHAISRGQYEKITPTNIFSGVFIDQIGAYVSDLRAQFTLPVALIGFLPFTIWSIRAGRFRLKAVYAAIVLSVLAAAALTLERAIGGVGDELVLGFRADKPLIAIVLLLLGLGGTAIFVSLAEELYGKLRGRIPASLSERITIGLAFAGAALGYLYYAVKLAGTLAAVTAPLRQAGPPVSSEVFGRVAVDSAGVILFLIGPAAAVILVAWLMRSRAEFRTMLDLHSQKWVIATLLGFLVMSLVLVALASPKGDIQDEFIQRVKFISSHGLYAFWVGYGLVFGLACLDTLFRENRLVTWGSLAVAFALPLIPIHENWRNKQLVLESGGAEQNGHDFGWQFGNYQLRGADAISEELSPGEEPLPNPFFPPEMGTNAIFFGGTDPGRFVPTYMIYCPKVREDVYLITQNALADNTYMQVMRDLYGDRIWIPATPDSAASFQRYVEEVQSGKRPKNAQLTIENGRVQVSGALGVMEINGILAQMIFERNNYRHSFYVEESYVIPWMYPYLTPHGLIMKINRDMTPLAPANIRDDLDFWDWYVRRLSGAETFRRDIVARKSFSKLRSAIAGLYATRGNLDEAERAFQEARLLYPLSPEANFRLVQEVLMRQRRLAECKDIMTQFGKVDVRNSKVFDFLGVLDNIDRMNGRIGELEKNINSGHLDINGAIELADLYQQAGQVPQFLQLAGSMAVNSNMPSVYLFRLAQLYSRAGRGEEMIGTLDTCLDRLPPDAPPDVLINVAQMYAQAQQGPRLARALTEYVRRQPRDWKAWMDLAAVHVQLGQTNEANRALSQALAVGGPEARALVERDPRFQPLLQQLDAKARNIMSFPGLLPP